MKVGQAGLNIIKKHEGLYLDSYVCPAGVITIGYGHTKDVKPGQSITVEQADEFLKEDLKDVGAYLNKTYPTIQQHQFDSLASLIFNIGQGSFADSTLKKIIDSGKEEERYTGNIENYILELLPNGYNISDLEYNFLRWCKGGGVFLRGLFERRKAEYKLYSS